MPQTNNILSPTSLVFPVSPFLIVSLMESMPLPFLPFSFKSRQSKKSTRLQVLTFPCWEFYWVPFLRDWRWTAASGAKTQVFLSQLQGISVGCIRQAFFKGREGEKAKSCQPQILTHSSCNSHPRGSRNLPLCQGEEDTNSSQSFHQRRVKAGKQKTKPSLSSNAHVLGNEPKDLSARLELCR